MRIDRNIYVCPHTGRPLKCDPRESSGSEVLSGVLSADGAPAYLISDGMPVFIRPDDLTKEQSGVLDYYEGVSTVYDDVANLTFRIQYLDEDEVRRKLVDLLKLTPCSRVLELAPGTGRDSVHIARALDGTGQYYLLDISKSMLVQCREKLADASVPTEFSVGNACELPFPDRYFDAVFSFGGLCVFGDIARSMKEIARVSKLGARVAVGDESMAPWLYDTEYGRLLMNTNPLLKAELPLKHLPPDARDVRVQWVIGGAYFMIDFVVGDGEPKADFDLEIPGVRGGTLRTRYYGKLEGVSPETFRLAHEARKRAGLSMHKWLDDAIRKAAMDDLGAD